MKLPLLSIRKPVTITMLFVALALLGFFAFSNLGVDLLPNINMPKVMIQTQYSNATPEEVEKLISEPLESAVGTVSGVKNIKSVSKEGISVIFVDFVWGTNLDFALLSLREKLDNATFMLPRDAGRPTIIKMDPSTSPILTVALSYKELTKKENVQKDDYKVAFVDESSSDVDIKRLIDLKEISRVVYKRRFEQIEGVAQSLITGGIEREILIEVDPQKLLVYNLSYAEIAAKLKASNMSQPAGSIMKGLFRYSLRTIGEFQNINEIEQTVIKNNKGTSIRLKDIAKVREYFKEREGLTRLNGSETIGLLIYKEPDANTVTIAKEVKKVINILKNEYPEYDLVIVSDQSGFIEDAIENVKQEILYGGILAVVVLFFFLGSLRNIFIIGITIPASLVLTFLLMYLFNINFNIISLGGIALGIGMLLDNAIVVIENVVSYREKGMGYREAAIRGSAEVAMPIVAATLTTIAVFLPLVFMKGIAGEIFKDQSYAVVFSLVASIFTAITLIPMLAARESFEFIKNKDKYENGYFIISKDGYDKWYKKIIFYIKLPFIIIIQGSLFLVIRYLMKFNKIFQSRFNVFYEKINKQIDRVIDKYEKLLKWSLNNKRKVMIGTLFLFLLTIFAVWDIKKEFIPEGAKEEISLELEFAKGISLKGNADYVKKIENILMHNNKNVYIVSNIGKTNEFDFLNKERVDINKSQIIIKLKSESDYYAIKNELPEIMGRFKGLKYSIQDVKTAYSQILSPSENDIVLAIKNKDIEQAYIKANSIIDKLNKNAVEGLTNLRIASEKETPEYQIIIDREKCQNYNINVYDAAMQIIGVGKGEIATSFSDFDKKIGILLRSDLNQRNDIDILFENYIQSGKVRVPIKNIAEYKMERSYSEIWREEQSRVVYIYGDVKDRSITNVIEDIEKEIRPIEDKKEEIIKIGGTNEEINNSFSALYVVLLISVLLMYMILASEFESFVYPFIIIFSVPLGLIGGILILYILGESISIISIMGLIILVGIADNDAVVKVEFILRKRAEGLSVKDAIMEAGKDRFRPIVMNSLTVIFGLIPMIIGLGAGTQLRVGLSLAIAGGLVSATFLTLIIIPILYTYMEKLSRKNR